MNRVLKKGGVAIVTVLLVLAVLAVMVVGLVNLSSNGLVQTRHDSGDLNAQYAAEAGAWRAVSEISDHGATGVLWTNQAMEDGGANYTVEVTQGPANVNGTDVPDSNHYYVDSVGRESGAASPAEKHIGMLVKSGPASTFDTAIFVQSSLHLDNGFTEVLASAGPPPPTTPPPTMPVPGGWTGETEDPTSPVLGGGVSTTTVSSTPAHVGTNDTLTGTVSLANNSDIDHGNGDVIVGPGGGTSSVNNTSSNPTAFHNVAPLTQNRSFQAVILPYPTNNSTLTISDDQTLPPDQAYGDVTVGAGATLRLDAAHVYQFKSLTVNGGTIIRQGGSTLDPTNVYIEDGLSLTGTVDNQSAKADKLRFFVKNGSVRLDHATARYVLYAPDSTVDLVNGCILEGALMAGTANVVGAASARSGVRYDPALTGQSIF
ncbi:MAG: hypothetical protein KC910_28855, partial [Candidatus Eremiobacteraeota bacterium]|nr:hypothetical protein [Candidatus Eremiobacteraeota bacterium]